MRLVQEFKSSIREFIDSFYCHDFPSKRQLGSIKTDNWFVLTDNLHNELVYSGGVGKDITFEFALGEEYGCHVFLFDPSPTGIKTVASLNLPPNISYFPVGLSGQDNILSFGEPVNPKEGSFRLGGERTVEFECRSISSLMKENHHDQIELLKIDIEGFEYDVIEDIIKNKLKIRQIAVEFHDFYKEIKKEKTQQSIRLLKANGYKLIHKRGHDYTFVKTDTI
jgi:FkbM family methyltransferase